MIEIIDIAFVFCWSLALMIFVKAIIRDRLKNGDTKKNES